MTTSCDRSVPMTKMSSLPRESDPGRRKVCGRSAADPRGKPNSTSSGTIHPTGQRRPRDTFDLQYCLRCPVPGANVKLTDLRGILQYIPQFREKTFIIAVDGAIVTDENFANILLDVAVLRSLNIRVVLVHGAAGTNQGARRRSRMSSRRTSTAPASPTPTRFNSPSTPPTASRTRSWKAFPPTTCAPPAPTRSSRIRWGSFRASTTCSPAKSSASTPNCCRRLLNQGIVPVVPPLGFDGDGKTYRVNSDSVAVAVAEALKATKLIFITSQDGLHLQRPTHSPDAGGGLAETCCSPTPADFAPEMLSKAHHAVGRLRRGRAARPHHQRPRGRRSAGRSVLQRRHRHADLRQRIPADPAGEEERCPGDPAC